MKKSDLVSIGITFLVGIFAGGYLYLVGFASVITYITVPSEEKLSELSVTADMYGGCRNACSSFQITADGVYKILKADDDNEMVLTRDCPQNKLL